MALTEFVVMPGKDYQDICNSVRVKTGRTELLKSGEIAPAIEEIEDEQLQDFIQDKIKEYANDKITKVGKGAFAYTNIQKVSLPNCTQVDGYGFYQCPSLEEVNLPKCTSLNIYAFSSSSISEINLPEVKTLGQYCFTNSKISKIVLPKCTSIGYSTFANCGNLSEFYSPLIQVVAGQAFQKCPVLKEVQFDNLNLIQDNGFSGNGSLLYLILSSENKVTLNNINAFQNTPFAYGWGYIFVPSNLVEAYKTDAKWQTYKDVIFAIQPIIIGPTAEQELEQTKTKDFFFDLKFFDSAPNISFTESTLCEVINQEVTKDYLKFTINAINKGYEEIIITADYNNSQISFVLPIQIIDPLPYDIFNRTEPYGFIKNNLNYYESNNKGYDNSSAVCRVVFNLEKETTVYFDCINYAENNYDYGLFSNLDTELGLTNTVDNSSKIYKNFKGQNSSEIQTVTYSIPMGEHFIDIKFLKDTSNSSNNDSLQFKIRFD